MHEKMDLLAVLVPELKSQDFWKEENDIRWANIKSSGGEKREQEAHNLKEETAVITSKCAVEAPLIFTSVAFGYRRHMSSTAEFTEHISNFHLDGYQLIFNIAQLMNLRPKLHQYFPNQAYDNITS